MAFDELTAACIREVAELERRLEHTRQWTAARWERLSQWAREELPEPLKVRFFNILANGTADHMESPTLTQQYNVMKHRAEKAESELVRLRAADPGREYRELLLLAAADLESWMKSYHRDAATADTVKRLRDAALGVRVGSEADLQPRILKALESYAMRYTQGDDGERMPLVDMLTPPEQESIAQGKLELAELAHHIADELAHGVTGTPDQLETVQRWAWETDGMERDQDGELQFNTPCSDIIDEYFRSVESCDHVFKSRYIPYQYSREKTMLHVTAICEKCGRNIQTDCESVEAAKEWIKDLPRRLLLLKTHRGDCGVFTKPNGDDRCTCGRGAASSGAGEVPRG